MVDRPESRVQSVPLLREKGKCVHLLFTQRLRSCVDGDGEQRMVNRSRKRGPDAASGGSCDPPAGRPRRPRWHSEPTHGSAVGCDAVIISATLCHRQRWARAATVGISLIKSCFLQPARVGADFRNNAGPHYNKAELRFPGWLDIGSVGTAVADPKTPQQSSISCRS
ncbi:hypothetical protein ON010_g3449 [Phytophthora cinnamomi]|nr:hypothetical protein ON010_g3449 [Phytophthora cinnamomi]